MRYLFSKRPVVEFENYRTSHLGAGAKYHERFSRLPGRALMWDLEKLLLREIVSEVRPVRVLDFACGTGRISSFIEGTFSEPEIWGVDISESMLDIARSHEGRTQYKVMDTQGAIDHFGEGYFDLILAFRFFANAEQALRLSVGADLCRLLSNGGSLLINNHRNFWSSSYILRRLLGQKPVGALNGDIERIFVDQGLQVRRKVSLGVWPQGDSKAFLLSWAFLRKLERSNLASTVSKHTLGYNTIWVFSK